MAVSKLFKVDAVKGETANIKPSLIVADMAKRGRSKFADEDHTAVKRMVSSFRASGQLQPVLCYRGSGGKPNLVVGFTRWLAGCEMEKHNPEFTLEVKLVSGDDAKLLREMNIRENTDRTELSEIDHAYRQRELRDDGYTGAQIAKLYGWDAGRVSRAKKLLELDEDTQRRVHTGDIAVSAALALLKVPEDQRAALIEVGHVTADVVQETARKLSARDHREDEKLRKLNEANPEGASPPAATPPTVPPTVVDTTTAVPKSSGVAAPLAPRRTKPIRVTTQRSIKQVKDMMARYTGDDTHVVIRTVAQSFMSYVVGECDEEEVAKLVCKLEGVDYSKETPVK
jgi:ParB-like chromosome segregation protein Spo0J